MGLIRKIKHWIWNLKSVGKQNIQWRYKTTVMKTYQCYQQNWTQSYVTLQPIFTDILPNSQSHKDVWEVITCKQCACSNFSEQMMFLPVKSKAFKTF